MSEGESSTFIRDYAKKPMSVLFVGKTGRGKSHALKWMLLYLYHNLGIFKGGYVFSTTAEASDDYDYIPEFARLEYSDEKLEKIIESCKEHKKKTGEKPPRQFIVFDDLLGILRRTAKLENLITTARHYNIAIFFCTQHLRSQSLPTWLREQVYHRIVFRTANRETKKVIYQEFGGEWPYSVQAFSKMFNEATKEPYSALLISDIDGWEFAKFKAPADYPVVPMNFE